MTIIPVLTFSAGIAFAAAFEMAWAFLNRRYFVSVDKGPCVTVSWMLAAVLAACTGFVRPHSPPENWMPCLVIGFIHIAMAFNGESMSRRPPPPQDPGSHSRGTSVRSSAQHTTTQGGPR